jgi:hypothetical protein
MARGMQEELDRQNPVIDDIDQQMDKVTNRLKNNNMRLKALVTQVGGAGRLGGAARRGAGWCMGRRAPACPGGAAAVLLGAVQATRLLLQPPGAATGRWPRNR